MGNRDKRNDKVKKQKKSDKLSTSRVQATELPPPVEVVRKRRKPELVSNED